MKKTKKALAMLLTCIMTLSLISCGSTSSKTDDNAPQADQTAPSEAVMYRWENGTVDVDKNTPVKIMYIHYSLAGSQNSTDVAAR